jgi:uroporphyrinogen III methyltransferase/synthase
MEASTTTTSDQPLLGRRIVVTRPAAQAGPLLDLLRALGAEPLATPAIAVVPPTDLAPLDRALDTLGSYQWLVFSSANAVESFESRRTARGVAMPSAVRFAAIGSATAAAAAEHGIRSDFSPSHADGDTLAAELPVAAHERVLWPRADLARAEPVFALRAREVHVDDVVAYHTVADAGLDVIAAQLRDGVIDAITFSSSSAVRHLLEGFRRAGVTDLLRGPRRAAIVCIGPVTARAAREAGLEMDAEAATQDDAGLVQALIDCFHGRTGSDWRT